MGAPARLGLYGLALVAVFAGAGFTANALVPKQTVQNWTEGTTANDHAGEHDVATTETGSQEMEATSLGLGLAQDRFQLTDVGAPSQIDTEGKLSLTVTGPDGSPVTSYEPDHDKELHLIVVRADGQHFRHVHPERDAEGTWSIPWEWEAAGTYRVFADFVPAETGEGVTLSTSVQVAGDYAPEPPTGQVSTTTVDGFEISVTGDLVATESSPLTITINRDGEPVTKLEPYLGAFGHLVALRDGDLAYLHVHPHGQEPHAGETSGPQIVFEATAPTPGRYLLYLDFQVDGQVHTAPLILDTTAPTPGDSTNPGDSNDGQHHGDEQEEGGDHDRR